jgi:hypothetical protein
VRSLGFLLFAGALACSPNEVMPPGIGDFDGSVQPPPGGGITGGDGGDAAIPDGGAALANASNPAYLAVSGTSLYYTNFGTGPSDGTVSSVPLGGGTPTDLASGLDSPWALTVAGNTVYFTISRANGTGAVFSVPTAGGAVTSIQDSVTGTFGIVNDGTNLFWTLDSDTSGVGGVTIEEVALAGGTPKQLIGNGSTFLPDGLAIAGTDLYVPGQGTQSAVYHATTSGAVALEPLDTPEAITYADVAVSQDTVYATIDDIAPAGAIVSFPRQGGVAKNVATNLNHPQRLALDGTNLYFTDPDGGNVWVVDLTSSNAPVQFATGLASPLAITVADAVYVGTSTAIYRFAKM